MVKIILLCVYKDSYMCIFVFLRTYKKVIMHDDVALFLKCKHVDGCSFFFF